MDGYLLEKIQEISQTCHTIQTFLKADQTHFSENNIAGLGESNKEKARLLEQLAQIVGELRTHIHHSYPGQTLDTLDPSPTYQDKIATLKMELQDCYQALAINNHVVYANLQQLKDIWDKIIASQKTGDCIYDHTGILTK